MGDNLSAAQLQAIERLRAHGAETSANSQYAGGDALARLTAQSWNQYRAQGGQLSFQDYLDHFQRTGSLPEPKRTIWQYFRLW